MKKNNLSAEVMVKKQKRMDSKKIILKLIYTSWCMKSTPSNLYISYISIFFRYIMQVQHQCCSNEAVEVRADGYFCFPPAGQRMAQLTKHSV